MLLTENTICAISTAPGQAGISVIRLSGKDSKSIAEKLLKKSDGGLFEMISRKAHFANLMNGDSLLDQVVAVYYKSPRSYTGEDVVEIATHGSEYVQQTLLELLINNGAKLAEAGEFTRRAFVNGKLDLSQSEAIADIIASESKAGHQVAINQLKGNISNEISILREQLLEFVSLIELELDFGEEDVEFADRTHLNTLIKKIISRINKLSDSFRYGNAVKNGIPVAIVGPPNTGKSSLLNTLLNEDKAIVSDIPGTTRDTIEDKINISGFTFRFIDTAGLRETEDKIENLGIVRTNEKISKAAIVLLVLDSSNCNADNTNAINDIREKISIEEQKLLILQNKTDLLDSELTNLPSNEIALSVKDGNGVEELKNRLLETIKNLPGYNQEVVLTNARHFEAFSKAKEALERAEIGLQNNISQDFISQDIREALHYLGEVTGSISTDEILGAIFSRFCIGK